MGLGEKDGEEFNQSKVALIPVFKPHMPNEFGLGGHVVVSDHAAVPPVAEPHADEASDEMVGMRGGWGVEGRRLGGGGVTFDPSRPMGQRGWRWWEMGGRVSTVSPPVGICVGGIYERMQSPLVPLPTYKGGWDRSGRGGRWERGVRLLRIRGRRRGGRFA